MKASDFLWQINELGIKTIIGVPDSTLKHFCSEIQVHPGEFRHYTPANEGAAVGIAVGEYLASGNPACVYMQNSGMGNAVNPICSIACGDIYGVPIFFVIGWRGEPGKKDEPQHLFQGKITCALLDTLSIPYAVIDENTTKDEMLSVMKEAKRVLSENRQFAVVVKKGTFEAGESFLWDNGYHMIREEALEKIIETIPRDTCVVSTTGKISREIYEKSNALYGDHKNIFMTVGGMGHASMIAYGIAVRKPGQNILCIDGDGAALMHMGALAFIAAHAPKNFYHVIVNNQAHESVGGMPTDCPKLSFVQLARAAGYSGASELMDMDDLGQIARDMESKKPGPILYEVKVSLKSRSDLTRPIETAEENKNSYMRFLNTI